jgi:hypothetical protein
MPHVHERYISAFLFSKILAWAENCCHHLRRWDIYNETTEKSVMDRPPNLSWAITFLLPMYFPVLPYSHLDILFTQMVVVVTTRWTLVVMNISGWLIRAEGAVYNTKQWVESLKNHHSHHPWNFFPWPWYICSNTQWFHAVA